MEREHLRVGRVRVAAARVGQHEEARIRKAFGWLAAASGPEIATIQPILTLLAVDA